MEPAAGLSSATALGTTLQIFVCNKSDSTQWVSDGLTANRSERTLKQKISNVFPNLNALKFTRSLLSNYSYSSLIILSYRKVFL